MSAAAERGTQRTGGVGGLLLSLALHGALAGTVFLAGWTRYLPLGGQHPGTAAAGALQAKLVSKVPGGAILMPSPVTQATKNRLANNMAGQAVSRPRPRAAPRRSVALPSYLPENLARQQAAADLRRLARADSPKRRGQKVPYGAGGPVSFSASNSVQGAGGGGGLSFGDANFGYLYTDWVNHLRDRLQYYWNEQPRFPGMPSGVKVKVTLTVQRAGTIDAIRYVGLSPSVQVNAMALRTVRQLAKAERFPLPAGYGPSQLVVTVAFELN